MSEAEAEAANHTPPLKITTRTAENASRTLPAVSSATKVAMPVGALRSLAVTSGVHFLPEGGLVLVVSKAGLSL